jgi:hypothetical protein
MADTICSECGTARGMEWGSGHLVRNLVFFSLLFITESLAVLYHHSPVLQYLFMRKGPCGTISLLEDMRYSVNLKMVRPVRFLLAFIWLSTLDVELDIILSHDGGHSTEPVTLFLKITVSPDASPSLTAPVNTEIHTAIHVDNPPVVEGNGAPPTIQVNGETTQPAVVTPPLLPLSRTSDLPIESSTSVLPASDSQTEMPRIALRRAEEAVNTMGTWGSAVGVVKQVMDAVSPISSVCPNPFCLFFAESTPILQLHPYASLAWSLLSKMPEVRHLALSGDAGYSFLFSPHRQTLLQQVQRDDNVRSLFEAICDAFAFAKDVDALRRIKPESVQAKILEDMLERVSEISKFIESYAKDVRVGMLSRTFWLVIINTRFAGKRTWKNIRGQVDGKITQYRTILIRLRDDFLARAAVTTEVTVLRTQDDVSRMQDDVSHITRDRQELLDSILKIHS